MKTKTVASLLAIAALFATSCEQHKWTESKQLFESHGDHAAGEAHGHGDAHEKKADDHGHGDAKAEGHKEEAKH